MVFEPVDVRLFEGKTAAPGVTDDINQGYEIGDIWVDEANDNSYQCQDNAAGVAVWAHLDAAVGITEADMIKWAIVFGGM